MINDLATRMLSAARRLYEGGEITTRWFRESHGASKASAKLDMIRVEQMLPVNVEMRAGWRTPEKVLRIRDEQPRKVAA